ncbi:hypothetical protein [Lutibacter citreus]|uniref:hypothetical protein n=1 Tax=Lutibacter citreus TaxID=2138210 RepID=UPI000DBE532B|nr:hypothetical protein [Lutibacter citreus]
MKVKVFIIMLILFSSCSTKSQVIKPIISEVDVTDMNLYKPTPYRSDGAGYEGSDFKNLPKSRKKIFSHISDKNDTDALNELITNLNALGGGEITITKGDYKFKNVILKSNIHIIIESGTIIGFDETKKGKAFLFNVGSGDNAPLVENVKLIGLGNPDNRPKLVLHKFENTFWRAVMIGYVNNLLVQNFTIVDDLTKGAAIAFNPSKINDETVNIANNVTITNVKLTGGSIGYGLVQTNVGENILLKNLSSEGGMTCRIEAHTGRHYDVGVANIVIKNIVSKNGKAAVLLQPHSVENGRILVDGAKSIGSTWTLFLKNGFVAKDSKRRLRGTFAPNSTFKNISLISTDNTATLSYKNYVFIPEELKSLYNPPNFNPVKNDANNPSEELGKESAIKGPSVAVIYIDAKYPLGLPEESEIVLEGKTENRLKILDKR